MKAQLKIILVSVAIIFAADTVFAQSVFTNSPQDSITATVALEAGQLLTFQQQSNSAGTLNLSWQQISVSMPAQWTANLCDYGHCYPDLPTSGAMFPVPMGDYGLMTLDIKPHAIAGTAIIRYAVWDASAPAQKDTLTWIVHSVVTGISTAAQEKLFAFVSGNTLFIKGAQGRANQAFLLDITGRTILKQSITSQEEAINLSFVNDGLYILMVPYSGTYYSQKILIGSGR